ncbi:hypothetical protein QFZ82_004247 [Streptomyces sp. V4I23]|uniref:hypothetical protein n=1 Tax=Streptomyces sp. V4I23 TaxID=3042282 RepID=UPI0027842703|nr:hypothetical protein [Streptomyces sp. V4I23]MDQ1009762.1 hypothetical protein [Streptomyces sp. V4I23]
MFLPRHNAHFVMGPTPLLLLGGAPVHEFLPPLHAPDGRVPLCDGWQLMPRLTMTVVDGPGDAGCLVQGAQAEDEAEEMSAWCSAVEQAGGAVVLSLDTLPDDLDWPALLTDGRAHGGFVPAPA